MKRLLALAVLLNYLAVLLAAQTFVRKPLVTAETPYVHAKDCQQHNYLKLDCFDTCNKKYNLQQAAQKLPLSQANLVLTGLDAHVCVAVALPAFPLVFQNILSRFSAFQANSRLGFSRLVMPPPEVC